MFRISTNGTFKVLHRFDATNGYEPVAYLIQASDGNFYGTTQLGGQPDGTGLTPAGTVFQMTPAGTVTFLHNFYLPPKDGSGGPPGIYPTNPLVETKDGAFCSTISGCTNGDCIYKINPLGEFSEIYDFTPQEALSPGRLILGSHGLYYSYAQGGGLYEHISNGDLF